jgi:RecB family endonuclease NucS
MRLVIANCSVDYAGRLSAHLPPAVRLLLVKADGSVSIHSDGGAYKPLNWMSPPCHLSEEPGRWVVSNAKGETLTIRLHRVEADAVHDLGEDPGLSKDGVEAHLQELLAANPDVLGDGLTLVRREYPTDIGPVDLLFRDGLGRPLRVRIGIPEDPVGSSPTGYVAVEVKRHATIAAVDQLSRYLQRLNRNTMLAPVRGVLAARTIAPQARTLARERDIGCVIVDYDDLRGREDRALRLF